MTEKKTRIFPGFDTDLSRAEVKRSYRTSMFLSVFFCLRRENGIKTTKGKKNLGVTLSSLMPMTMTSMTMTMTKERAREACRDGGSVGVIEAVA
jgi:hypothetical protein